MMYYIMQQTPLHLHSAAPVSAHSEADVRLIEKTKSRGYPQRKLGSRQHRYTDGDDIVCVRYSDCVQGGPNIPRRARSMAAQLEEIMYG